MDRFEILNSQTPFWHLSTSGRDQDVIFENDEDYGFGLTSSALALIEVNGLGKQKVKIIAYALRDNHIHEILAGDEAHCIEYFKCRKRRLRRYFARSGRAIDLSNFNCKLLPINSLEELRNEILYVNNTDYEEDCLCDYYARYNDNFEACYTSGKYYFQDFEANLPSINSMSFGHRMDITKCDNYIYPDWYKVHNSQLYPPSFCDFHLGEKLFGSEEQYHQLAYPAKEQHNNYGLFRKPKIFDILKKRLSLAH